MKEILTISREISAGKLSVTSGANDGLVHPLLPEGHLGTVPKLYEEIAEAFADGLKLRHVPPYALADIVGLLLKISSEKLDYDTIQKIAFHSAKIYQRDIEHRDRWRRPGIVDPVRLRYMMVDAVNLAFGLTYLSSAHRLPYDYRSLLDPATLDQGPNLILEIRELLLTAREDGVFASLDALHVDSLIGTLEYCAAARDCPEAILHLLAHLTKSAAQVETEATGIGQAIAFWEKKLLRVEHNELSRQPLAAVGDSASDQGADIVRRFGVLTKPMLATSVESSAHDIYDLLMIDYPWMEAAIDEICDAVYACHGKALKMSPLLLWGPPGSGKTKFCMRVAEVLGLKTYQPSMAGLHHAMSVNGTERGWSSTHPSLAAHAMASSISPNPLILIDEIDKVASSDVAHAFLPFLEDHTAKQYHDHCLMGSLDTSGINWIFTANDKSLLPAPFISRCTQVHVNLPTIKDIRAITHYLESQIGRSLTDVEMETIRGKLMRGASLRDLGQLPRSRAWKISQKPQLKFV